MSPNNDEAIARLRLALHTVADRTPMGEARAIDCANLPSDQPRSRTALTVISAAAAVAAIAAVSAVVATNNRTHTVSPGAGGLAGPASSASASRAPISLAAPDATASTVPTPVRSATSGSASPQASPCVPENYYVIASAAQLAGMTYLLPSTPSGYTFYGAWGTISRNDCPASQTWYAEYDQSAESQTNISISVRHSDGGPIPAATASTATAVVQGHPAFVLNKSSTYGILVWQADGLDFYVGGPMAGGRPDALVALANTLTAVSPTDPRIVAPANCQVEPGNTCPDGPQPKPTPSSTPGPTN